MTFIPELLLEHNISTVSVSVCESIIEAKCYLMFILTTSTVTLQHVLFPMKAPLYDHFSSIYHQEMENRKLLRNSYRIFIQF